MVDYWDQIKEIEDEIKKTQYNKATQHHIGLLKAKIARLKEKDMSRSAGKGKGKGYSVRKSGDATVIMVGFPSVGKSTLLNAITGADSEVGAYDFTTLDVVPGLLEYEHAKIQVLDVPGIVHGAASGRGRGREVLSVMRNADLALIIVDVNYPGHLKVLRKEIYESGLRLDESPPDIKLVKKSKGGVDIATTVKLTKTTKETITSVLKEFKITNAGVVVRSDITVEQLIDIIEGNKIYIPSIVVLNKIDMVGEKKLELVKKAVKPDICISADKRLNIEELNSQIFKKLNLMRVYCKEVGKKADLDVPLIMKRGATIGNMCEKLHKDFIIKFKFAKVWGPSARFAGQKFKLNHKMKDTDVIELHIR